MNAPFYLEKSERLFSSAVGYKQQSAQTEYRGYFGRLGDRERHIGACRSKHCFPHKAVWHAVKHSLFNIASALVCYNILKYCRDKNFEAGFLVLCDEVADFKIEFFSLNLSFLEIN